MDATAAASKSGDSMSMSAALGMRMVDEPATWAVIPPSFDVPLVIVKSSSDVRCD